MRKVLLVCLLFSQITWALDRQPNSDFRMRRQSLASKATGGVVLLFASNEAEGPNDLYGYRPDDNFFYLSGWSEPGAALLIVGAADPKDHSYTEILFLPNHNPSQEKWTGPKLGADSPDAGKLTGFDHVEVLDNLRSELVRLLPAKKAKKRLLARKRNPLPRRKNNPVPGVAAAFEIDGAARIRWTLCLWSLVWETRVPNTPAPGTMPVLWRSNGSGRSFQRSGKIRPDSTLALRDSRSAVTR